MIGTSRVYKVNQQYNNQGELMGRIDHDIDRWNCTQRFMWKEELQGQKTYWDWEEMNHTIPNNYSKGSYNLFIVERDAVAQM